MNIATDYTKETKDKDDINKKDSIEGCAGTNPNDIKKGEEVSDKINERQTIANSYNSNGQSLHEIL